MTDSASGKAVVSSRVNPLTASDERKIAALLKRNLPCERVCVAVVGWEVRHVHVHLVPTDKPGEFPPLGGPAASAEELEWIAQRIRTGSAPAC